MTDKERVELIRKGNQLFNEGKIEEAGKIFLATNYKDGLVRVGDYYFFQEKKFYKAFFYYKKANYKKRLDDVYKKWAEVIHFLLEEDKSFQINHEKIITDDSQKIKKYEFPKIDNNTK